MNLHKNTFAEIIQLISPIMTGETQRKALCAKAFMGHSLFYKIDYSGSADVAATNIVQTLIAYGEIKPGEQALWTLLQTVRGEVGCDKQDRVDALEDVINESGEHRQDTSRDARRNHVEIGDFNTPNIVQGIFSKILDLAQTSDQDRDTKIKSYLLGQIREVLKSNPTGLSTLKQSLSHQLAQELENRAEDSQRDNILLKVYRWLEDEIILICPKDSKYIKKIREALSKNANSQFILQSIESIPIEPNDSQLYLDIEFKSEFLRISEKYRPDYELDLNDPISLVAQCIFIVCYKDKMLYTLHDRSYSGAEDRVSKYSLITGRISVADLPDAMSHSGKVRASELGKNTLLREFQEPDELGLSSTLAKKYTKGNIEGTDFERIRFIDVYEDENGKVLSFLFAILVKASEYNRDLTKRGPYLVPVDPKEFSKLRTLGLLNDILHHNSCNHCTFDENVATAKNHQNCAKCTWKSECRHRKTQKQQTCIIWRTKEKIIGEELSRFEDYKLNPDENLGRYRIKLTSNAAIIVIDISDYALLSIRTTREIREQLKRLIYSFLPIHHNVKSYKHHFQATPTGYSIILSKPSNEQSLEIKLALIAYFLALYLNMKFSYLKQRHNNTCPDIRIGLHTNDLTHNTSLDGSYFLGSGLNEGFHTIGQPKQILCSQNFAVQLLAEIEETGILVESYSLNGINHLCKEGRGIWNKSELSDLLASLNIPPSIIMEIYKDLSIEVCFQKQGLPIHDLGFFVQDNGLRYRVFNLGIFNFTDQSSVFDYGNVKQPIVRIPIIYRTTNTTNDELELLVDSLQYAKHLTIYGYSNIRTMKKIYMEENKKLKFRSLMDLRVVFYSYDQYKDINEKNPLRETQVNWIRGFIYAHQIATKLRNDKTKVTIAINEMRYGFNVFKVLYDAEKHDFQDNIRFTVPMPGQAFHLSPVFIINRGDTLYHGFLEICEKYIERGIKENSDAFSITEYEPNDAGKKLLEKLFLPGELDTKGVRKHINDVRRGDYEDIIESKEDEGKASLGEYSDMLLAEGDFDEAYRLWICLRYFDEFSKGSDEHFDYQRFLREFFK